MSAVERLLDEHAFLLSVCGGDHDGVVGGGGVEGDHDDVGVLYGEQSAGDGLGGHAEGADESGVACSLQGLKTIAVVNDGLIVAVGVDEHDVEIVGAQALQAALDAVADMLGAEVERRHALIEFFPYFGTDNPALALLQQFAEAFFAVAIGGGGVDQVHAGLSAQVQEVLHAGVIGQFKIAGVFDAFVAANFHGAQAKAGDLHTGLAEGA